ncbi:hypothetical protein [Paenibacillus humicola]|uniref:hypothetical protein n=1 Tax=Paenibacillus humicola TaxID=3110540 RepID=UPI00237C4146|nr:hypothetical protein [Paenibacillus humicola]
MKPVVGIDVAKGSSVVQAFVRRDEPYGALKTLMHDEGGFERLGEVLDELKAGCCFGGNRSLSSQIGRLSRTRGISSCCDQSPAIQTREECAASKSKDGRS